MRVDRHSLLIPTLLLGAGVVLAAPGNLDPDFGDGGLLRLQIGELGADAFAVLEQADGKAVLVGTGNVDGDFDHDFIAVRLNAGGSPDPGFGTGGMAAADFAGSTDYALAGVQQADGKLVLAGFALNPSGYDIALARFNDDGSLDSDFGNGGRTMLDLGGDNESATGIVLQPSGGLVVAGYSNASGLTQGVLARFNPDGSQDLSFGTGGTSFIDFGDGSESWINDLAAQPDGKLVAGGAVYGPDLRFDMSIIRLTENGIPDSSFDGDGLLFVDFDGLGEQARSIAVQLDGAIVAAGYTVPAFDGYFKLALLRLHEDGSLDASFGTGGKSIIDLGTQAEISSLVVQSDGKLAASGTWLRPSFYPDAIVARFESNGTLDTSFGSGGVAIADFGEQDSTPWSLGFDLIQRADGNLLMSASVPANFVAAAQFDDTSSYAGRVGLTSTLESVDEETASSVSFTIRRTGGHTDPVSVDYETQDGSAQDGSDFVGASGTLDWSDGDASDRSITIDLINDTASEHPEKFSLLLSTVTGGARLAARQAAITINSIDGPGELKLWWPWWSLGDEQSVMEDAGVISLPVSRSYGSEGEVKVQVALNPSSATHGSDFEVITRELTWADGDMSSKPIEIRILDDTLDEGIERIDVQISNATGGATIAAGSRLSVFIYDNDPPGSGGGGGGGGDGGGAGSGGGGALDWLSALALCLLGLGRLLPFRHNRSRTPT